jgi:non-canonical purine NTP pyrophosphatase (RdgB/HAM1 family)
MPEILLATKNPGKIREIRRMTADSGLLWRGLDEFLGVPAAVEDGDTFAENARRKALHYAGATEMLTLADDSGLEVDALDGGPGVNSARFAGRPRDDARNNRKLVQALSGVPAERRTARFVCAMAFARPGEVLLESHGSVAARIVDQPRGTNGFGYDPHFFLPERGCTMAELSPDEKNAISHRAAALRAILPRIQAWLRTSADHAGR